MKTRFKDFLLLESKKYNIQRPANVPEEYWYDVNQDLNRREEYLDGRDGNDDQGWRDADKKLHRDDDKPADIRKDGTMWWWINGQRHRMDGPAYIFPNGTQYWYVNGDLHRLDGPAYIYPDGHQRWYMNGKKHRLDGPAEIYPDGSYNWWVNGWGITDEVESTPAFWPADKRIASAIWKRVKDGWGVMEFYNCNNTGELLFPEVKELLEKYPQRYFELPPDDDGEINLDDHAGWCDQASNDCFDL